MPSGRQFVPHVQRPREIFTLSATAPLPPTLIHTHTHLSLFTYVIVIMVMKRHLLICLCESKLNICSNMHTADRKALNFELWVLLSGYETVWRIVLPYCGGVRTYSRFRNKEKTQYCLKKLSIMKPPMVRTELAAASELTSEPLSSCMPLSLPACLTACLSPRLSLF